MSELAGTIAAKFDIDYVFYDSGPSIGPLNRSILLDSSFFIAPVACDLFSLRALKTMAVSLVTWIKEWEIIASLAPEGTYLLKGRPSFLGYIPLGFKVYRGIIQSQAELLKEIDKEVLSQIVGRLNEVDPRLTENHKRLGLLQNFGSLATKSLTLGVPFFEVYGVNDEHRSDADKALRTIAQSIIERAEGQA